MHDIILEINFPTLDDTFENEIYNFPLGVAMYMTLVQLENRFDNSINDVIFYADEVA